MKRNDNIWKVTRDCCTSGNCLNCAGVTRFGTPERVTHGTRYSKEFAEVIAKNWLRYNAKVEPMDKEEGK